VIKKYGVPRDQALMKLAIEQARRCVSEDGKVSPMVGAVVVRPNGSIIDKAYRGERKPGEHAEYTLLERKLEKEILAGSVLYTTLEPCTERNYPKLACAQHIIDRKIKHVVIGVLDPNPQICGKGERWLTDQGIEVTRFTPGLMREIEELNRYFNRLHKSSGPKS
jgi:pyrimidine deaminase RibD-like protein